MILEHAQNGQPCGRAETSGVPTGTAGRSGAAGCPAPFPERFNGLLIRGEKTPPFPPHGGLIWRRLLLWQAAFYFFKRLRLSRSLSSLPLSAYRHTAEATWNA
jgi:hypothetical protein